MPTNTQTFTNPADYTLTKAKISGGLGTLDPQDYPDQEFPEDFADDTGFTYDSTKAEFVTGQVQAKDQRPSDATFGANFNISQNANWGDGNLTGTFGGTDDTGEVTGGELVFANNDISHLDFDAVDNADNPQKFDVIIEYTPYETGIPTSGRVFFHNGNPTNTVNRLACFHYTAGEMYFSIFDKNNATIYNASIYNWQPSEIKKYELRFAGIISTNADGSDDGVNGQTRFSLWIDKTLVATITPAKGGERDPATISVLRLGRDNYPTTKSYGKYDSFIWFSEPQDSLTEDYTTDYIVPTYLYATSRVTLPEMVYPGVGTLQELSSVVLTYTDTPHITLQIGRSGNYLYWNGSEWVTSNRTYSQSNDITTFNENVASLPVVGNVYGQFELYFPDSNIQASVSSLVATVTAQIYETGKIRVNGGFVTNNITSLVAVKTDNGGTVRFVHDVNGTPKFYNTTTEAWETSDESVAKSNIITELTETILGELLLLNRTVTHVVILDPPIDGQATPSIDTLTTTYGAGALEPGSAETCQVFGFVHDLDGQPVPNAIILFEVYKTENTEYVEAADHVILIDRKEALTNDAQGYFTVDLPRSSEFEEERNYKVTITRVVGGREYKQSTDREGNELIVTVPDAVSVNITELINS